MLGDAVEIPANYMTMIDFEVTAYTPPILPPVEADLIVETINTPGSVDDTGFILGSVGSLTPDVIVDGVQITEIRAVIENGLPVVIINNAANSLLTTFDGVEYTFKPRGNGTDLLSGVGSSSLYNYLRDNRGQTIQFTAQAVTFSDFSDNGDFDLDNGDFA